MFMRYQFGMSVGHTYMHTSSFPAATIPAIPPDFDHCLDAVPPTEEPPTVLTLSGETLQHDAGTRDAGLGDVQVRALRSRRETDTYVVGHGRHREGRLSVTRQTNTKTGMKMVRGT
jgi:hypothetical protein